MTTDHGYRFDWIARCQDTASLAALTANPTDEAMDLLFVPRGGGGANDTEEPSQLLLELAALTRVNTGMLSNPNPRMAAFVLRHPEAIFHTIFSENECDLAVDYYLANPQLIYWDSWNRNPNDRAFRFLVDEHRDKIKWYFFRGNRHPEALAYYLQNGPSNRSILHMMGHPDVAARVVAASPPLAHVTPEFSLNESDAAVQYLLAHPHQISLQLLCRNPHPLAVAHLRERFERDSQSHAQQQTEEAPKVVISWVKWYDLRLNPNPDALDLLDDILRHEQDQQEAREEEPTPLAFPHRDMFINPAIFATSGCSALPLLK